MPRDWVRIRRLGGVAVSWFQVWFWFTIATAAYLAFELWRAPLMPDDFDRRGVDELHESTVRIVDDE